MEPRLTNVQEISRCSQLHNAYRDVNVGREAANKREYYNPNHFNISYFRNPRPYSLFGFAFMQLITWTLALITSPLLFFDLNQLTMGVKVEFVYNVLTFFVIVY